MKWQNETIHYDCLHKIIPRHPYPTWIPSEVNKCKRTVVLCYFLSSHINNDREGVRIVGKLSLKIQLQKLLEVHIKQEL